MEIKRKTITHTARWMVLCLALSFSGTVLAGCGRDTGASDNRQPTSDVRGSRSEYPEPGQRRKGLSTKQKVAILTGAAALYYLYHKHKAAQGQGPEGQYYLSKNGRVYYRDRNGNPVWVTPPPQGIQVPESEAEQYRRFRGYNGQETGETFGNYGAGRAAQPAGPPGPGY